LEDKKSVKESDFVVVLVIALFGCCLINNNKFGEE